MGPIVYFLAGLVLGSLFRQLVGRTRDQRRMLEREIAFLDAQLVDKLRGLAKLQDDPAVAAWAQKQLSAAVHRRHTETKGKPANRRLAL